MHHLQLLLPLLIALDHASSDHQQPPPATPISEHEYAREVVNPRPYPGRGVWKRPPKHVDVGFVPAQTYAQVRSTNTVLRVPRADALASATTSEEVANAPRLREVVKHTTIREVYEEEGFGDNAYDHAGYKKTGEHDEAYSSEEASKKKRSGPKHRTHDSEGQHSQPIPNKDGGTTGGTGASGGGNRNLRGGKVTHQMEISRGVEKTMEGGAYVKTGSVVRETNVPRAGLRFPRPRVKLLRGEVDDYGRDSRPEASQGQVGVVAKSAGASNATKGELKKRESRRDASGEDLNEFADDVNKDMTATSTKYLEAHAEEERLRQEDEEREEEIEQHVADTSADILKGFPKQKTGVDHAKFPYYRSTVNKHSPLRYALHPREIPDKRGGDLAFYASKDGTECEEVTPPVITRGNDKEGRPKDKLPRLQGQLGDKIKCFKDKYWGEEPLDNPFFSEGTEVGVGNKKRAVREGDAGAFADSGFYSEIVGSIKHLESGSFPEKNFELSPRDLDYKQSYKSNVYAPSEERNENYEDDDDDHDNNDDESDEDKENESDNADRPAVALKPATLKPYAAKVPVEHGKPPALYYKPKERYKAKVYPVRDHAIVIDLTPRPIMHPITQPKFRPSPVDDQPPRTRYVPPLSQSNPPAKIQAKGHDLLAKQQANAKYRNILGMFPPPANAHFQYQTLTYLKPKATSFPGPRFDSKALIDTMTMATANYVADLTSQQNKVRILRTKRDVDDGGNGGVEEEPKRLYKKRVRVRRPLPRGRVDSSAAAATATTRFVDDRNRRKVKQYKVTEDVKEDFGPDYFKSEEQEDVVTPSYFRRGNAERGGQSAEESEDDKEGGVEDVNPTERTKPKRRRKLRRFKRPLKSKWVNYQAFEVTDKDGTKKEVQWKDSDGDDKNVEREVVYRPRKNKSKQRQEENRDDLYKEGEGVENLTNYENNKDESSTESSSDRSHGGYYPKGETDDSEAVRNVYRRRKTKKNQGASDGILDEFSKEAEKKNEANFYKRRRAQKAAEDSGEADAVDEFVPKYDEHDDADDHDNTYANRKVNKDERWADRTLDELIGKIRSGGGSRDHGDDADDEERPRKRKGRRRPGANIDDLRRSHGDTLERLRKQHDTDVGVYSKPEQDESEDAEESHPFGESLDGLIAERLVKLKDNDVPDDKEVKVVKVIRKISTTMTPLQEIASKYPQMWMENKGKEDQVGDQVGEATTSQTVEDGGPGTPTRRPKNSPPDAPPSSHQEEYSVDARRREPMYKQAAKGDADNNRNNTQVTIHEEVRLSGDKPPPIRLSTEEINAKLSAVFKGHKFGSRYNAKQPETNVNTQRKLRADAADKPEPATQPSRVEERIAVATDNKTSGAEPFRGRKHFKPRPRPSRRPPTDTTPESRTQATVQRSKTEEILESKTRDQRLSRRPSVRTTAESPTDRKLSQERARNRFGVEQEHGDDVADAERLVARDWPRRSTTVADVASGGRSGAAKVTSPTAVEETTPRGGGRKLSRKSRHKATTPTPQSQVVATVDAVAATEAPKVEATTTSKAPRRVFIFKKPTTTSTTTTTTAKAAAATTRMPWTKKQEAAVGAKPEVTTRKSVTLRYSIPVKDIVVRKVAKDVETNKIDRSRGLKGVTTERSVATTTPRVLANFETRRVTNQETFTRIHKLDDDDDDDDDDYDGDDDGEDDEDFYDTYFGDDQDPFQSQRTEKFSGLNDKDGGRRVAGFRGEGNFLKDRTLTYVVDPGENVGKWVQEER